MVLDTGNNESPLRYESCVVEDLGLLLSPLDNLLYELGYMLTAFSGKDEKALKQSDIINRIVASKIPKKDVLNAIMSQPNLKETYNEDTEVYKHLTSF